MSQEKVNQYKESKKNRKEAVKKTGLSDEEIGVFFISPCPAKVTAVKQPLALAKSDVSGVIAIKDVYMRLAHALQGVKEVEKLSVAGKDGVRWARSGGETEALGISNYIAVDGIHNVIKMLEELEDDELDCASLDDSAELDSLDEDSVNELWL